MDLRVVLICGQFLVSTADAVVPPNPDGVAGTISNIAGLAEDRNGTKGCVDRRGLQIVIFFLGNYVAHAATVPSRPGQSVGGRCLAMVTALIFPTFCLATRMASIVRAPIFARTELEMALRAGALCTIVKADKDRLCGKSHVLQRPTRLFRTQVFGLHTMPSDYGLVVVPRRADFDTSREGPYESPYNPVNWWRVSQTVEKCIARSRGWSKASIALGQVVFATTTLYQAEVYQIPRFGYASYGLTVTPYALMSLVNLVAALLCPEYPTMYVVELTPSKEVPRLTGFRDADSLYGSEGTIGSIKLPVDAVSGQEPTLEQLDSISHRSSSVETWLTFLLVCVGFSLPITIIGSMSRFEAGSSTPAQRVWIMLWLLVGYFGGAVVLIRERREYKDFINEYLELKSKVWRYMSRLGMILLAAVPAVGGFVVVDQMLYATQGCS